MNQGNKIGFGILILFLGVMIFFLFRPFAYAIAIAAIITLSIVALWYLLTGLSRWFRRFRLRNTIQGILEEKLENVSSLEKKLADDIAVIEKELKDVQTQLEDQNISNFARNKLISLKDAFEQEHALKSTKIQFYIETAKRFQTLLSDHKVLQSISNKKERLSKSSNKSLPDEHGNDQILSLDKEIIEDLDFLIHKMNQTEQLLDAREIQKELIEL